MEALEGKDVRHDSFEEVSRILSIVENAKKEYQRAVESMLRFFVGFLLFSVPLIVTVFFLEDRINTVVHKNNIENLLIAYLAILWLTCFCYFLIKRYQLRKKRIVYKTTVSQATELLREVIPVLARTDNWSALRQFELRLRLSKLGISSEKLFAGPYILNCSLFCLHVQAHHSALAVSFRRRNDSPPRYVAAEGCICHSRARRPWAGNGSFWQTGGWNARFSG